MFSATTYDTTRARIDQARIEAEIALRLDSSLVDSHSALAQYWERLADQRRSTEELETALRLSPNNPGTLIATGNSEISAGHWDLGISRLERATLLDPRNPSAAWFAAVNYGRLRRNDKGMVAFDRLIDIWPNDHMVKTIKGQSYLRWKGSVDMLESELRTIPPDWDGKGMATYARFTVFRVQRKYRDGLAMLDRTPTMLSWDGFVYHPKELMRAELYEGLGQTDSARVHYALARKVLMDSSAAHPENPSIHAALGLADAGVGLKREASHEAEKAMSLVPVSRNSRGATAFMGMAVETFAHIGDFDRCFEMIELMLSMPSGREITLPFLRVWPGFDPLRKDPRFDQIIARFTVR
jgi:tetratricopeptide (TPR) repeat protein